MAKKILFITNSFGMGGAEKLLIDIVKVVLRGGFEVDVLAFSTQGVLRARMERTCKVFTLFDSTVHSFLFRKIKSYRKYLVTKFIATHEYDIVVGFMEGKPTALLADIGHDVKTVAWVHNDFRKLKIGLTLSDMYRDYSSVDQLVCVSCDAERAFFEILQGVATPSQVIYNLIDEKTIAEKARIEKIINKTYTFLNVAMLRQQKRQDRLIKAASALKQMGYSFHVQIIGDGPLRSTLELLIENMDVADCVTLLGMKENPYPYISQCDCFVLTSDYEGYGIAVKEALFFKRLIITTDVVGPKEILKQGKYGLVVKNNLAGVIQGMKSVLDADQEASLVRDGIREYCSDNDTIEKQLCELFSWDGAMVSSEDKG